MMIHRYAFLVILFKYKFYCGYVYLRVCTTLLSNTIAKITLMMNYKCFLSHGPEYFQIVKCN